MENSINPELSFKIQTRNDAEVAEGVAKGISNEATPKVKAAMAAAMGPNRSVGVAHSQSLSK